MCVCVCFMVICCCCCCCYHIDHSQTCTIRLVLTTIIKPPHKNIDSPYLRVVRVIFIFFCIHLIHLMQLFAIFLYKHIIMLALLPFILFSVRWVIHLRTVSHFCSRSSRTSFCMCVCVCVCMLFCRKTQVVVVFECLDRYPIHSNKKEKKKKTKRR